MPSGVATHCSGTVIDWIAVAPALSAGEARVHVCTPCCTLFPACFPALSSDHRLVTADIRVTLRRRVAAPRWRLGNPAGNLLSRGMMVAWRPAGHWRMLLDCSRARTPWKCSMPAWSTMCGVFLRPRARVVLVGGNAPLATGGTHSVKTSGSIVRHVGGSCGPVLGHGPAKRIA